MLVKILCWPFYMPVKMVQTLAMCAVLILATIFNPYEVKFTWPGGK